jgi:hypothetical protein
MKKREPRTVDEFRFSKTSLTDLENDNTCPARWKAQHLDFLFPFVPSVVMQKGSFFEQQCIGISVDGEDDLKWPEYEGVQYERTLRQAEKFKQTMEEQEWEMTGVQILGENDRIKGVWDIEAINAFEQPIIADLKFTMRMQGRPPYSWARLDLMDHVQLAMYKALGKDKYGTDFDMYYYVADVTPQENVLFKKMRIKQYDIDNMYRRVDDGFDLLRWYEKEGYPFFPSQKECSKCTLECKFRDLG